MITDLLASDNYIICNKTIAKEYGLYEAILLGELCSEYNYWKKENKLIDECYFYSTAENIEINTTIKEKSQRVALNNLCEAGFISTKLMGLPAKKHFKINEDIILNFYNNNRTSSVKSTELEQSNLPTNNNNKTITLSNDNVINEKSSTKKKQRNYLAKPVIDMSAELQNEPKKLSKLDKSLKILDNYKLSPQLYSALSDFLTMKNSLQYSDKKYLLSESSTKSLLDKKILIFLNKYSEDDVIQFIRTAITEKWASVFELQKNDSKNHIQTFNDVSGYTEDELLKAKNQADAYIKETGHQIREF